MKTLLNLQFELISKKKSKLIINLNLNVMKKFYMILAALLIGSVCFAQEQTRSAWVGSSDTGAGYATIGQDMEYAMAPKAFDANITGNITKVKFYHGYSEEDTILNTSYTIKIYTNPTLGGSYTTYGLYDLTATEAYTQNYDAGTEEGWKEVELTTPFAIPSGDFWVAIKANNGDAAVFLGGASSSVEGQTYMQYDFTSQIGSIMWVTPEFGSQGNTTLYTIALSVYVDDGAVYVPTSDLAAQFFGPINAQGYLTAAPASYTLTSADQEVTLLPFFRNNGVDDLTTGVVTIDITANGVSVIPGGAITEDLGTADDTLSIPVGGWYNIIPAPYSYTLTAQDFIDAGLSGTFDICITISCEGGNNDTDLTNNSHCIPVTLNVASVEENVAEAVSVYPNPANDMFTVANAEGATIVVVNSLGQVVTTIENAASNQTIDASSFANGTYFVKVNEEVVRINVVK